MLMRMHALFTRFTFEMPHWVKHLRPGIVPSLGEGVGQEHVYRHCTRRVWR